MTTQFDWSQFEEVTPSSKRESENTFDWTQFEEVSPEEKPQEISRTRSLVSAPVKGLIKGAQLPFPFNTGPVPAALGEKLTERFLPTQKKTPEKFLEKAGELAPAIAIGPESLALKAAQLGSAAALGTVAEKEGLGKFGTIVAEIVGMSIPGLSKALGSFAKKALSKGPSAATAELAAKTMSFKPSEVNEGLRESAKRLGVLENVPVSSQIKNNKIQSIETKLAQSTFGKPVQAKVEKLGEQLGEEFNTIKNSISKRESLLPSVVADEASSALKSIEEAGENAYRDLYRKAENYLPQNAVTTPKIGKAINRIIDSTLVKLESALGTPAKDALFNRLTRLKKNFSSSPEKLEGIIPVRDIQTLKQDLNQVIKYELKGGVDKLLNPLQNVTKEAIQSYGRQYNPSFLEFFNKAEKAFGQNAQTFRKNPLIRSLVKGDNPQQIFSKMNTVKGINEIEKVLGRTPEGTQTFDALKKYKLEELLNNKVLDKNGNISWGKAAGALKNPKTRELVMKLVGPQQYKRLKDLSQVASGVEEGFAKFLNTSKTASTAFDMGILVGMPIKIVKSIFTGDVKGVLTGIGGIMGVGQIAKIIANPKFAEAAIATAKAGRGSKAETFIKAASEVAKITVSELIRPEKDTEE